MEQEGRYAMDELAQDAIDATRFDRLTQGARYGLAGGRSVLPVGSSMLREGGRFHGGGTMLPGGGSMLLGEGSFAGAESMLPGRRDRFLGSGAALARGGSYGARFSGAGAMLPWERNMSPGGGRYSGAEGMLPGRRDRFIGSGTALTPWGAALARGGSYGARFSGARTMLPWERSMLPGEGGLMGSETIRNPWTSRFSGAGARLPVGEGHAWGREGAGRTARRARGSYY
jgi:hypothetical protein